MLPSHNSEGERQFTDQQLQDAQRLMDEVPRIEAALKNYLSLKIAEGLAPEVKRVVADEDAQMTAAERQGCARVLLKTLNSLDLPPAPEWGMRHPQGENESGCDYMTRIGAYKVVQALWKRCCDAGQKPAKMLGRTPLRLVYPEIVARIMQDAAASAASAKATEKHLREFLDGFCATVAEDSDVFSEAHVVWAEDLKVAISQREEARQLAAAERVQRAATVDDFAGELRTALGRAGASSEDSTVEIEEILEEMEVDS